MHWIGSPPEPSQTDLFSSFTLPRQEHLENIARQVLRQTLAHEDLEAFLSGQTDILSITPYEFEKFVGALYARKGYQTTVTKASHDGGFDAIAFSDEAKNGVLIQAKHTKGTVGIRIIRELIGARFLASHEYENYMLVIMTTGKFSRTAKEAENQVATTLKLVDYSLLQSELMSYRDIGTTDILLQAAQLRQGFQQFDP